MTKRKGISKTIRFEVFKRDSFTCQYCGKSAPDTVLEVDHIIPVSKGGDNNISNLITSCFDCNRGKSDKKLSENQTIKKQKDELDNLNKRREQLEMMSEWRTELIDIENKEADRLMKLVSDSLGLKSKLTDIGRTKMKKIIKKYGFDEVLESATIAYEQYDIDEAFYKIESIIKNRKIQNEHPELKDLYYIRAIVKNRFAYYDSNVAIILLKKCYELGATIDSLKEFTKECENWTQWKDGLNEFIEEQNNKSKDSYNFSEDDDEEDKYNKYQELCKKNNVDDIFDTYKLEACIEKILIKEFKDLYDDGYSWEDIKIIADYIYMHMKEAIYPGAMMSLQKYIKR